MKTILKAGKPRENTRINNIRDELAHGSKTVKFSMNIPRKLHGEFRKKAFLSNIDMKDILLEAIREYLNEKNKGN